MSLQIPTGSAFRIAHIKLYTVPDVWLLPYHRSRTK
jgi:hypothetical protein